MPRRKDHRLPREDPIEPFKNQIDARAVAHITRFVGGDWDRDAFTGEALDGLDALELKARVVHVADALRRHLAPDWPTALAQVVSALPEAPTETDELTTAMGLWPVLTLVERHGLDTPDASLSALERLTPFWSAEFAVRPYFRDDPEGMVQWVDRWSRHDNVHVRRLASEGSRPRLPWGIRLQCRIDTPKALVPSLERLRDDPSEYVRRSVANHLNDIAKDHPDVVLEVAQAWLPGPKTREKLVRHALRTQIKACDPRAYTLLGLEPFGGQATFTCATDHLYVGEALALEVTLESPVEQRVRLDLGLHFLKKNGTRTPKVFHWSERTLKPGKPLTLRKSFKVAKVSTRVYHPGEQGIDLRINGVPTPLQPFVLYTGKRVEDG